MLVEVEGREFIAYALIAIGVALVAGWAIMARRRRYWKKRRMSGHSEAKRREIRKY
ncbi:LPXTG cell wall anchor domain-containing protein [Sphingomonas sp. J315]|uniref:LPXTG cell wall anchor domain-containing protein n=1 Tax=Sphingomonas sp. J315 TaxID=2898433 RepID=UPI0021ADED99|nr:LPXTG cell wall anchor domain-containing protein [Sphingomonas sp. J315]UUY00549.1 LPXTG cell wall anchor domain-containing protein [Sphingomonas sp. J315]